MVPNKRFMISLIGTNPLPAFITILKNCERETKLYLIHTEQSKRNIGSKIIAKNLKRVIEKKLSKIDITLIECDKSDTRKINNCINKLFREIEVSTDKNDKCELVLDYTSGTKAMSAIFADRVLNADIHSLSTLISYVDDNQNVILEDTDSVGRNRLYSIRDIVRNIRISIEDVAGIHGHGLHRTVKEYTFEDNIKYLDTTEEIVFVNNSGNSISPDEVYLLDGKLVLCYKSRYLGQNERIGKLKMELFEFKDKAEKLGGSRSLILYKTDCSEENKKALNKYLRMDYEFEMSGRLYFVNEKQPFKDRVKDVYLNGGGN